eukprot:1334924-Amorphochlora_amoeboformis.AAC.2
MDDGASAHSNKHDHHTHVITTTKMSTPSHPHRYHHYAIQNSQSPKGRQWLLSVFIVEQGVAFVFVARVCWEDHSVG